MKKTFFPALIALTALTIPLASAGRAYAQEGGGAGSMPPASTVVKGKAPINDKVLSVKLPRPKEYTLPNGAKLYVLESHRLPTVSITVSVRAGDLFEDKSGVAGMTADVLTEGTTSRPYAAIAEETDRLGASLNANAGPERASISVSGLAQDSDALIALLADAVQHPAFAPDRLARTKFRQMAGLMQRRSDPSFLASEFTRRLFYGEDSPFGRPSPSGEQIQAITAADLKAFHDRLYVPNQARILVAGDVKADDIAKKLQAAFADWKPASKDTEPKLPETAAAPKEKTHIFLIDRPGSAQTVLSFGNIAIKRTDPDYIPLLVANRVLGGSFNSRLNQKLREEKGYTYGASSGIGASRWVGLWSAGAQVRTAVTADAVKDALAVMDKFASEPVPAAELDQAKRSIVGGFALTLENPAAVLSRYMETVEYGLPSDYWDTYPAKIQAVTPADVERVAKKYLGQGRIQLVAVGERSAIESGLVGIAPVSVYNPDTKTLTDLPAPSANR